VDSSDEEKDGQVLTTKNCPRQCSRISILMYCS